jgi:hypothetical protein
MNALGAYQAEIHDPQQREHMLRRLRRRRLDGDQGGRGHHMGAPRRHPGPDWGGKRTVSRFRLGRNF